MKEAKGQPRNQFPGMKKIPLLLALALLAGAQAQAQAQAHWRPSLAFAAGYNALDQRDGLYAAASLMASPARSVAFGLTYSGFAVEPRRGFLEGAGAATGQEFGIEGSYLAAVGELRLWPARMVHVALPLAVGAGVVHYKGTSSYVWNPSPTWNQFDDRFVLLEPALELRFYLFPFMRMDLRASYRWTSEVELTAAAYVRDEQGTMRVGRQDLASPAFLRAPAFGIGFAFGKF